jgi:hypothetical protein
MNSTVKRWSGWRVSAWEWQTNAIVEWTLHSYTDAEYLFRILLSDARYRCVERMMTG